MSITIEPLSSAIGAEIRGVDLRDTLSGDVVTQIIGAFYEHGVILFRSQELTEDQQLRFKDGPEMIYEHVWHSGDLLVWDNLCSCHARTDFASTERRLLRRCTVLGEPLHE